MNAAEGENKSVCGLVGASVAENKNHWSTSKKPLLSTVKVIQKRFVVASVAATIVTRTRFPKIKKFPLPTFDKLGSEKTPVGP